MVSPNRFKYFEIGSTHPEVKGLQALPLAVPTNFAPRDLGLGFRALPTFDKQKELISVELELELSDHVGQRNLGFDTLVPLIYSRQLDVDFLTLDGGVTLIGILTPPDGQGNRDPSFRNLVFVHTKLLDR